MDSLHQYLCKSFNNAICRLFPEINVTSLNLRFYLSSNNTFDICTPIAKQLYTKQASLPVNFLAQRICESIEWNNFFVQSVKFENITDGFINFSISMQYLHSLLFPNQPVYNESFMSQEICLGSTLNKIKRVVDHAVSSYPIDRCIDFKKFSSMLICNEYKLLVLLAYLEFPESLSGRLFIINKIKVKLEEYYSITPIITNSRDLTSFRIHLLQKIITEITAHLH